MKLTKRGADRLTTARSLLNRLIELPDLASAIQALPGPTFAALVRKIGVEDAGELVALATTEQLVQAFDEDLFVNDRAGDRETFDVARFVAWLEVLLEAGDEVVADRMAALDEDFVAHALGGLLLVLDQDALRDRLDDGDEDEAKQVDKSLESALTEDIDGYILVAKQHDCWDAVLALVLALDRNHRALLVRLLDRLAQVSIAYLDDFEELSSVLSEGESLAEDAEAAREERRSKQGYVEARSARAFLSLARKPGGDASSMDRDPLTRAYFREIERGRASAIPSHAPPGSGVPRAVLQELNELGSGGGQLALSVSPTQAPTLAVFIQALRDLSRDLSTLFGERMEELAYLANVLVAGHERDGSRLRPKDAADAALATVCYGALIEVRALRPKAMKKAPPTSRELAEVLQKHSADILFRVASSALASGAAPLVKGAQKSGLLYSFQELEAAIR